MDQCNKLEVKISAIYYSSRWNFIFSSASVSDHGEEGTETSVSFGSFKSYFVCDLEHQEKCYGAWKFLEAVVYKLKTDIKSSVPARFKPVIDIQPMKTIF